MIQSWLRRARQSSPTWDQEDALNAIVATLRRLSYYRAPNDQRFADLWEQCNVAACIRDRAALDTVLRDLEAHVTAANADAGDPRA